MQLFTAGPVSVSPRSLELMSSQMFSHRSKTYKEWHHRAIDGLRFLTGPGTPILLPASATGFMEMAARNCLPKGILCLTNGAFGEKFARVMRDNGVSLDHVKGEWQHGYPVEAFKELLDARPDCDAVAFVHNETSSAVANPAEDLVREAKRRGLFVIIDAVTAVGGIPTRMEWGADVIFAGVQKCLGLPPSLAIANFSDEAIARSGNATNKGYYFDLQEYVKMNNKDFTPTTPPVPQIIALADRLEEIQRGGLDALYAEYEWRSSTIHAGLAKHGLEVFAEAPYRSKTITAVKYADPPSLLTAMEAKGFALASGYGNLKGETFRIGNMGFIPRESVSAMVDALGEVVA